jgi:xanthine dehydrogenase accessory factor
MKEIRNIIEVYDSIDHDKEKVALASVVQVEESSYRRIGARMLVRSSGLWVGGISGGCLEGDALRRSQKAIYMKRPSVVVYDTMDDDTSEIGVGLGCNGRIEVLLSPIDPGDEENEVELLKQVAASDQPSLMFKVIEADDDPDFLGTNAVVNPARRDATFADIDRDALNGFVDEVLDKKAARTFQCKSATHGELKVLIEFIRPETRLVIVGDNYDVTAMVGIATELGWESYVLGNPKKLAPAVHDKAKEIIDKAHADQVMVNEYTAVVLMSHDFRTDKKMLPIFLAKKPAYLGILGPRKRFYKLQSELPELFLDEKDIHSPTGLEIGAESPPEIALSIAAEIVAVFRDKPGTSLRYKEGPIYERVR